MEGVMSLKKRNGYKTNKILSTWQVQRMNTPIKKYIRTIKYGALSMDRSYTQTTLNIVINIPAFKRTVKRKEELNLIF
jgi:hypothetical protein